MRTQEPKDSPRQKRIIVQDVRDYTSADGAASANEEMRRIAVSVGELQDRADMSGDGGIPVQLASPGGTGDTTIVNEITNVAGFCLPARFRSWILLDRTVSRIFLHDNAGSCR